MKALCVELMAEDNEAIAPLPPIVFADAEVLFPKIAIMGIRLPQFVV